MPPFVKMTGLIGERAWRIDAKRSPYKLHIALWNHALRALASSYDATLGLPDELKEALDCDVVMRSTVIREVIAAAPDMTEEQRQALDECARAAGM